MGFGLMGWVLLYICYRLESMGEGERGKEEYPQHEYLVI